MSSPSRMKGSGATRVPSPNPSAWVDCFNSITVKRHSVLLAATHHLADTPAHGGLAGAQECLVLARSSPALWFAGRVKPCVLVENTLRRQHLHEHIRPIRLRSSCLTIRVIRGFKVPCRTWAMKSGVPPSLKLSLIHISEPT